MLFSVIRKIYFYHKNGWVWKKKQTGKIKETGQYSVWRNSSNNNYPQIILKLHQMVFDLVLIWIRKSMIFKWIKSIQNHWKWNFFFRQENEVKSENFLKMTDYFTSKFFISINFNINFVNRASSWKNYWINSSLLLLYYF